MRSHLWRNDEWTHSDGESLVEASRANREVVTCFKARKLGQDFLTSAFHPLRTRARGLAERGHGRGRGAGGLRRAPDAGPAMKHYVANAIAGSLVAASAAAGADGGVIVTRSGAQPSVTGASTNFTGVARVSSRFQAPPPLAWAAAPSPSSRVSPAPSVS